MISKSGKRLAALAAALMLPLTAQALSVHTQYNLQPPQSPIAEQIYDLHTLIMWIIFGIFVVVFGVMTVAIVKHRKSVGHKAAQFHENTTVEIIWTIVPFVILIGMAYPATRTVVALKDTSNPDITIKATGYQWKWGYDYLQEGVSFYSNLATPREQIIGTGKGPVQRSATYLIEVDNPIVVPVNKKVRIITTANDVIHAWWVPALGVKQDAIPGFVRDAWFRAERVGTYRGQCAELCGKDHGFMPIVVQVVEQDKYEAWVASAKQAMAKEAAAADPNKEWTMADLTARGEKVFGSNCAACHQASGMGVPGAFPPLAGSQLVQNSEPDTIQVILHGRKGTAMQPFAHLGEVDIAAVATYIRNSWTNKTGDTTTPAEVVAQRK